MIPPSDKAAESALIGALINYPDMINVVNIRSEDFYYPDHELIYLTARRLADHGETVHPVTVRAELARTGDLRRVSSALADAITFVPPVETAEGLAATLRDLAGRRELVEVAHDILRRVGTEDAATILTGIGSRLNRITPDGSDLSSLLDLDEFLDQEVKPDDAIIPKRLNRGERLIITGPEGGGKTTLTRQLGICTAAGIDAFDGAEIEPRTVLMVDAENPLMITMRRMQALRDAVARRGVKIDPRKLWIDRRPEGLNLANPADVLWLKRRVITTNPDMIVIGPAYKLYVGGDTHEEDRARQVTSVLDQLRTEVDASVILEHHSPHAAPGAARRNYRPIGSSLWLRWPEFGLSLRRIKDRDVDRVVEVEEWRGGRDERIWPTRLRSESARHGLPWVEVEERED